MTYLFRLAWRMLAVADFLVMTVIAWLLTFLPKKCIAGWYGVVFRSWCRSFCQALGASMHVHQHYAGRLPTHYILIANHPSAFEDIGIPALFPVTSLAKIEVRDWFVFGRISAAAGTLYVRREERESRQAALAAMIEWVRSGRNLAIYPEGGCHGRRLFARFQRGAFAASIASGVPIVPVFIEYEAQESFEWQGQTLVQVILQMARAPNRRVNLHVFDPLQPASYVDEIGMREATYALYKNWDQRFLG